MNEIKFSYNPFEAKVTLQYKGKNELLPCMGTGQNSRLQDWLYDFLPELKKKQNWGAGSQCTIFFAGTPGDFEDIEHAYMVFKKDNPGIDITLVHVNKESKSLKTRMSDLKVLFERMQKESPYEELKNKDLKPAFDRALNSDFEISVIATMSSGKSTLINALLGQEILPARNEATTAKIAQIRHVADAAGFTVRGLKKDENENYIPVAEPKPATLEAIEDLNSSDNIAKIELAGKIPGINSREMQLLLSDTPGPNNSRSTDHALHIDQLIKADYKPMIMYILNATQLEINDDKSLLEKISKAIEGAGKQGADRFLFVLNKADELDPDKGEFVEKKIADAKKYLEQFKIYAPRVFPASAYLAKIIRMTKLGNPISRKEQMFLNGQRQYFISDPSLHFSDYASLSPSCKRKQQEELDKAVAGNDENAQAFIYSGIRAIELAMDEYLEKYALTAKISKAVGVFITIINRLDLKNQTEKELAGNKEKRENVIKILADLKGLIDNGGRAKELIDKFDADIKTIKERLASSFKKKNEDVNYWFIQERSKYTTADGDGVSEGKAKSIVGETKKQMELQYNILASDLTRVFEVELKQQAEKYLAEYQAYIAGLMEGDNFTVSAALNLIQISVPGNVDSLLTQFVGEKTAYGTRTVTKTRENTNKKWYKPWTWGQSKLIDYEVEETYEYKVKVIKMGELFEESIQPHSDQFQQTIAEAKGIADQNADDLKIFFQQEIGKLDNALKETINRQQEELKSQEALEKKIEENKAKVAWLERFIQDLNSVLDI